MDRILHSPPEAMARFNDETPPELERIVRKCLEKDRGLRYQHGSELCTDLKRLKRDTEYDQLANAATASTLESYENSGRQSMLWRMAVSSSVQPQSLAFATGTGRFPCN